MANMYRSVLASGGTAPTGDAIASDVLTGKTFSNAQATGISGTMPNNGAVSGTASPSQPYTIPAGFHNGSGVVTAANVVPDLSNMPAVQMSSYNVTVKSDAVIGKKYLLYINPDGASTLPATAISANFTGITQDSIFCGHKDAIAIVTATSTTIACNNNVGWSSNNFYYSIMEL